jgi:cytochrome b
MAVVIARRRVWDLPTRLFHWLLVILIGFSWWSGDHHEMEWHYRSGLAVCALVVFRLIWGVFGSSTARFAQFVRGPRGVLAYLRARRGDEVQDPPGHNPLGGWSVLLLLALIALQVIAGLIATDVDGVESGPLSFQVSFDQGRLAASLHGLLFNILLAAIALHIAAILFYLVVRGRNLTAVMVTGHDSGPPQAEWRKPTILALTGATGVAGLVTYAVANGLWLQ